MQATPLLSLGVFGFKDLTGGIVPCTLLAARREVVLVAFQHCLGRPHCDAPTYRLQLGLKKAVATCKGRSIPDAAI